MEAASVHPAPATPQHPGTVARHHPTDRLTEGGRCCCCCQGEEIIIIMSGLHYWLVLLSVKGNSSSRPLQVHPGHVGVGRCGRLCG